jgi:hypothetical protein
MHAPAGAAVKFSDDQGAEAEVTVAAFAQATLEALAGRVPAGGIVPNRDPHNPAAFADPDARSAARADALKREHPEWSIAYCQEQADKALELAADETTD